MESTRNVWALVSYWALFIIAPTLAAYFLFGIGVCAGMFAILALLGEPGFRRWKRLWRVE